MDYIRDALRTESTVFKIEKGDDRLLHAGIGIATEAGEFLDAIKKHVYYGKTLDKVNLREELGDLLWYIAIAADELKTTFEELQATNIAKLRARYPEKFTEELAENRDLEKEYNILTATLTSPTFVFTNEVIGTYFNKHDEPTDVVPLSVLNNQAKFTFALNIPEKVVKHVTKYIEAPPESDQVMKSYRKLVKLIH